MKKGEKQAENAEETLQAKSTKDLSIRNDCISPFNAKTRRLYYSLD
jgi:hypothetical protein